MPKFGVSPLPITCQPQNSIHPCIFCITIPTNIGRNSRNIRAVELRSIHGSSRNWGVAPPGTVRGSGRGDLQSLRRSGDCIPSTVHQCLVIKKGKGNETDDRNCHSSDRIKRFSHINVSVSTPSGMDTTAPGADVEVAHSTTSEVLRPIQPDASPGSSGTARCSSVPSSRRPFDCDWPWWPCSRQLHLGVLWSVHHLCTERLLEMKPGASEMDAPFFNYEG